MPRRYPAEFRRKVPDVIEAGRPVVEVAAQLGVTGQTIDNWRNQDRIDRGLQAGVTTVGSVELAAARGRSRGLETELAAMRRVNELLKEQTGPKAVGGRRPDRERRLPCRSCARGRRCVGVGFYVWRRRRPSARAVR